MESRIRNAFTENSRAHARSTHAHSLIKLGGTRSKCKFPVSYVRYNKKVACKTNLVCDNINFDMHCSPFELAFKNDDNKII